MKGIVFYSILLLSLSAFSQGNKNGSLLVKTSGGLLQGVAGKNGIRIFKGVPYAAPPVGELRWKNPQPVKKWKGIRSAASFGNRAMQAVVYSDMIFRSRQMSEDCLYLNIWTNAKPGADKFPVFVYFHGGGLFAGDGSEIRYDGESLASKGVIVVTINYRLGIFGFFAHPELTKESPDNASGNYGLLDQRAALLWVKNNISSFGGDPEKVTIGGQSAGSSSVSVQMASPLSGNLFTGAIGESGSILGINAVPTLKEAEKAGIDFAKSINASSIAQLRSIPALQLLNDAVRSGISFKTIVDGYFLPEQPVMIYATGRQADVPLLAGWNSAEVGWRLLLGKDTLSPANYRKVVSGLYGDKMDELLRLYPDSSNAALLQSATDLSSDRFAGYSTWKWIDLHGKTNGHRVYRYLFKQLPPTLKGEPGNGKDHQLGAAHSAEIPYVFGNLSLIEGFKWTTEDFKISEAMQLYFSNFIKTGDPNGPNLPLWSGFQASIPKTMMFEASIRQEQEKNLHRYRFLDDIYYKISFNVKDNGE